ncbi:hypothetical protein GH714_037662 [Hevea brasiliensis]|uniref:DUF641 domain-containing protein n=1 Tax=Hevea brasiliensis TaxID=3981 RepID=A0A6A6MR33_HEVBR|nr:hypothetical protein GH714_037662 [Hevea brasiliensis]
MTEMMDGTSPTPKAPPISEMFQKFALAFKTKTFEFFADESAAENPPTSTVSPSSTQPKISFPIRKNPDVGVALPIESCLEAQVQENQSKLRVLGIASDHLQAGIDRKDNEVSALRKQLVDLQKSNFKLANRATHKFTKILIDLMRKAGWDLDLAANSVHADIEYAKTGHNRYAFLSYVCLGMFRGFDLKKFGLDEGDTEILCNGHVSDSVKTHSSLKQLLEHVSSSPVELLHRNPNCEFSKFCEKKYQELVHPTMESSIFSNLDKNEEVLNSWRSLRIFYESFVNMASAVWMLHKLAISFDPVFEIFQVERGLIFQWYIWKI